jgi:hypothetical protein
VSLVFFTRPEQILMSSLIAAEGAIANVVGMSQMNPPVKDLCKSPDILHLH